MLHVFLRPITAIEPSRVAQARATLAWLALAALGCAQQEQSPPAAEPAATAATLPPPGWHEQIAPLLNEKCGACHKPGGIGPFSVLSYASAKAFAEPIASAAERGTMPPFLARETADCTPRNEFVDDPRLSDAQKRLLRDWAAAGAPEGDASRAAALPDPPSIDLAREDLVVALPEPIAIAPDHGDLHTCVIIDPALDRDAYVVGRQIHSGNDRVLHHVVAYLLKPQDGAGAALSKQQMDEELRARKRAGIGESYECFGGPGLQDTRIAFELLNAWAPGARANGVPDGSGQPMPKDSLVVLNLHYHPTGAAPEQDSDTRLSLMFAEARPEYIARPILLGNFAQRLETEFGVGELLRQAGESSPEFVIPAGAEAHVEEMTWTFELPLTARIYASGTHMHYVGRDMLVQLEHPTPAAEQQARECLVHTPSWDYDWQRSYRYDAPYEQLPQVGNGDILRLRCIFDNTLGNPFLAEALDEQGLSAPIDVALGEDTLDEMCLASLGLLLPNFLP